MIYLHYDHIVAGTLTVSGGSAGTGGSKNGTGVAGSNGSAGSSGRTLRFNLLTGQNE